MKTQQTQPTKTSKSSALLKCDLLANKAVDAINFDGEEVHRTYVGACCSILIFIIILVIVAVLTLPVYNKDHPYTQQRTEALSDEEEILYSKSYQILLRIEDYVNSFKIDKEKVDVYVTHFLNKFNEDEG